MTLASPWYDSGTFWSAAGAVIGLVAIIAAAWVTLTVGFPRRRLYYGMRAAAPLLTAAGMNSDLELLHRGGPLTSNPHVVTIELTSRGRLDIDSGAYDSRQPLQLALGARIVEVLQVTSVPSTAPVPKITPDGTALKIGPSLIGKRQQITIDVLTDGGKPWLSCKSPLVNVQVRERDYEKVPFAVTVQWLIILSIVVGIVLAIAAAILASDLIGPLPNHQYYHLIDARHYAHEPLHEHDLFMQKSLDWLHQKATMPKRAFLRQRPRRQRIPALLDGRHCTNSQISDPPISRHCVVQGG